MAPCGCGGGAAKAKQMARDLAQTFGQAATDDAGQVVLEYTGPGSGTQSFRHPVSKREYRAGRNAAKRYIIVPPEDVAHLIGLGLFARHAAPAPFVPPPLDDEPATEPNGKTPEPVKAEPVKRAPRKAEKEAA
jgi:hypothetical protein